jgi:hypothetical protein
VCIPKAQAANKANGYKAATENLKAAIAARLKKNEVDRTRIVESLPELLPPQGLRCKALIHLIQETFLVSITHARVCIKLAVNRNLIYKTPGLTVWVYRRSGAEREDAPLVDREKIEAIKARIADEITPPFERNYKLLIAFYDEHHHWDIPYGKANSDAGWLWNRAYWMRTVKDQLPEWIKGGLGAHNFPWGLTRAERKVAESKAYHKKTGKWPTNSFMKRCRAVATGKKPSENITEALLDELRQEGWSPTNPQAVAIDKAIDELLAHYKQAGSWDIPSGRALSAKATWLRNLNSGKKKSKYWDQSHFLRLDAENFRPFAVLCG